MNFTRRSSRSAEQHQPELEIVGPRGVLFNSSTFEQRTSIGHCKPRIFKELRDLLHIVKYAGVLLYTLSCFTPCWENPEAGVMFKICTIMLLTIVMLLPLRVIKAADEPSLKVGSIQPLSGPGAEIGREINDGMLLCKPRNISLQVEDSQNSPLQGLSAFRKLTELTKVDLIAAYFSPIANAILPIARQKNFPVILTVVSSMSVVTKGGQQTLHYFTSGEQEGPLMAEFLALRREYRKAALLLIDDDYWQSYGDSFTAELKARGGEIVLREMFGKSESDFRSQLMRVKSVNPQALYFIGLDKHIELIVKQAKELGIKSGLATNWVLANPSARQGREELLEGVYLTAPSYYFEKNLLALEFDRQFLAKYSREPSAWAGIGCDIVRMLADTKAGSGEKAMQKLKALRNYPAIMGELTTTAEGDIRFPLYPAVLKQGKPALAVN